MPILKIHKNALYVNNELVKFQFEIDTVLVLDSQVIVLIKIPYDIDKNDNVYSVDFHGKITWQIESAKKRGFQSCNTLHMLGFRIKMTV